MDLKNNFIVEKGRAYMPILFTDVVVSTKCLWVGGLTLAKNVNEKRKNNMNGNHLLEPIPPQSLVSLKVATSSPNFFNKNIIDIDVDI